jgi:hypothetical protein
MDLLLNHCREQGGFLYWKSQPRRTKRECKRGPRMYPQLRPDVIFTSHASKALWDVAGFDYDNYILIVLYNKKIRPFKPQ